MSDSIEFIDQLSEGLKTNNELLEAGETIQKYKIVWQVRHNDLFVQASNLFHKIIDRNNPDKFKDNQFDGFDSTQNILFNNLKMKNKELIMDYLRENYNSSAKNIKRNTNVYWLGRISKEFESYKTNEKYYVNNVFNSKLYEEDLIKIQKIACDMLFSGKNKDYENVKYLSVALKNNKSMEYIYEFGSENIEKRESVILRTKQENLMSEYLSVKEPSSTLAVAAVVMLGGAAAAIGMPASIGYAVAGGFISKMSDILKTSVTIQRKFFKDEGGDKYNSSYNLFRTNRQWVANADTNLQILMSSVVENNIKKKPYDFNVLEIKDILNLNDSQIQMALSVRDMSYEEKLGFNKIRNPEIRLLYAKAAELENNRELTMDAIKNLDSLITIRVMEDNYFKEVDLTQVLKNVDEIANNDLPNKIEEAYFVTYKQIGLMSKSKEKELFNDCYKEGVFCLENFNNKIVEESSDLIENIKFIDLAKRCLSNSYNTVAKNFNENKRTEERTSLSNDSLKEIADKISPKIRFIEPNFKPEMTIVQHQLVELESIKNEDKIPSVVKERVNALTERLRNRGVEMENTGIRNKKL